MTRLALIGVGKIARDRHLPAIRASDAFRLAATAGPSDGVTGIPSFPSLEALLSSHTAVDAVAICTPPAARHALAVRAIEAGLHVLLEKPPAATVSQAADLIAQAEKRGTTLFAAWHSREAGGVAPARDWLAVRRIDTVQIVWREDIRRWHPGQDWILTAGGYGVFDPGINALSILTAILPERPIIYAAKLEVPAGRGAPIAAQLSMRCGITAIHADFDFRESGDQHWSTAIDTDVGTLRLYDGGSALTLPDAASQRFANREYPRLYRRFANLIADGASDVDLGPLQLVADAFLIGEQRLTEAFAL